MTLRMRVLPRFPARIEGGAGINIERPAGSTDLTVTFDISNWIRVPSVTDPDKVFFPVWNSDLGTYSVMSFTDTFAAVIDTSALMTKLIYDPQNKNADAFARANHTGTQAISTVSGLQTALDAKAAGPASAVNNRIAVFDATTGKLIKDGGVTVADVLASALLQDQKSSGTAGGSSVVGWQTRTLNTEVFDPAGIVTLASNQFTVAVDCDCHFAMTAYSATVAALKGRIWNVTDNVASAYSLASFLAAGSLGDIMGTAKLVAGKTYRLDMYASVAQASNGLGGQVGDGSIEIYSSIYLRRS